MADMRKALIATTAALGIALTACGGATDAEVIQACDSAAAAYSASTDALLKGNQNDARRLFDEFETKLTQYGDSLGGDEGAAFSFARTKLDAQATIDESLSEVNKLCVDAGAGAVTDLSD